MYRMYSMHSMHVLYIFMYDKDVYTMCIHICMYACMHPSICVFLGDNLNAKKTINDEVILKLFCSFCHVYIKK